MIVEWNMHLFSSDLERYPFHEKATYQPAEERLLADPLRDYLKHLEEERIDRAVLVHPEPYGDDHRLVLDCLEREPQRFKGTCLFYPREPDAPRRMEELVRQQPRIVATRFHSHPGYLDSFADAGVRALWEKAVELGLIVELHIGPNDARQIADCLRAYPGTTALIDHLAEPQTGHAVAYADVLDLAELDRVYMKLSGLGHIASDAPFYESVRPFTRRVIAAFGPARMVWGGGPPGIVDAHLEGYTAEERAQVKGGNLARLLDFA